MVMDVTPFPGARRQGLTVRHDIHVVKALLSAAFFLAHSDDAAIEGDLAIFELDAIAAHLQEMSAESRAAFVGQLGEIAAGERNSRFAEFVRRFAEDNGLTTSPE
jgi:hypothetical protein